MALDRIVVSAAGTLLASSHQPAWVTFEDGCATEVTVDELPGQHSVVYWESIDADLEELQPALRRSERYAWAEKTVHITNRGGRMIPRFRTELLKGLGIGLEAAILRERGRETTPEQETEAARRIAALTGIPPSTTRGWVKGRVIAPSDLHWHALRDLAPLGSFFGEEADEGSDFYRAAHVWRAVRSGIMRYLAGPGAGRGEGAGHQHGGSGSLAREIDLVLEQIYHLVDDHRIAPLVGEVRKTGDGASTRQGPRGRLHLRRGLSAEPPSDRRIIGRQEVWETYAVLGEIVNSALSEYLALRTDSTAKGYAALLIAFVTETIRGEDIRSEAGEMIRRIQLSAIEQFERISGMRTDYAIVERHLAGLRSEMRSGELDRTLRLPPGGFKRALRLSISYRNAVPIEAYRSEWYSSEQLLYETMLKKEKFDRKTKRELERKKARARNQREMATRALEKRGFRKRKAFFATQYESICTISPEASRFPRGVVRNELERKGYAFYSKGDITCVLERTGLDYMMRFLKEKLN